MNYPSSKIASTALLGLLLVGYHSGVIAQTSAVAGVNDQATKTETTEAFQLQIALQKPEFEVGEPIRFSIEGSENFFLYVFAEDINTGDKTMLLPNARQTYNAFPANIPFTVPDLTVEFSLEKPGNIRLTAIGTTEYYPIIKEDYELNGPFYSGMPTQLEETITAKGLAINTSENKANRTQTNRQTRELSIVEPKAKPVAVKPDSEDSPVVMVSSSCAVCAVEKPMKLGFSADRDGQIVLLLVEPGGNQTTLFSEQVTADQVQYVTAIAEAPSGNHTLIALFGEAPGDIEKAVSGVLASNNRITQSGSLNEKGLRIMQEPETLMPHAVRQFVIVQ